MAHSTMENQIVLFVRNFQNMFNARLGHAAEAVMWQTIEEDTKV